ncbi:arsenate reductase (glutaredoxin) [Methylonatrum kenyense]|uniref:arsenate reductase (glutaredoxin) n=1 Tax=Methylonatrum kenyense TaxID=455253 RepID=UPI00200AC510|nr:arsenate reductase (glutaredoxin) [Methylonatrum kenyense]MCK8516086.1 arsenate reductase (glutaredoxin) [Methylonatrum kenyense]
MMQWKIYHNPRCSKSRQALQILRDRGIEPQIIEYLKNPPSATEVLELMGKVPGPTRDLLRTGDTAFRESGIDPDSADTAALAEAVSREPRLLQRPIVVHGQRAVVARPPEALQSLLEAES